MSISTKYWKLVLAVILSVFMFTTLCASAFADTPETTAPEDELDSLDVVVNPVFLGPESDPDGEAYFAMYERIETRVTEYTESHFGMTVEEFVEAVNELSQISVEEMSAYCENYMSYSFDEAKRLAELRAKYSYIGGLGFGNETVKEIPKAELLTRLFKEWELEVLRNESSCFWNEISNYTSLRLSDGRFVADVFEDITREEPEFEKTEEREAWRESWLNFLDGITVDGYGYFHALSPTGEDYQLLGGINASTWIYTEIDFDPEYLNLLPSSEHEFSNQEN